jgi:hypothetical protein
MKKKGLIVATIVMVLVLAVSLTTATYAWFTNEGSATVDAINFTVASAADIVIGVEKDNEIDTTSPASASNFYSDATNYSAAGTWTGTTNNLGLSISHDVDLRGMTKAIYSFNSVTQSEGVYTGGEMTTYNRTTVATQNNVILSHGQQITQGINPSATYIMKANGNGNTISYNSMATTQKNGYTYNNGESDVTVPGDYLDIAFGAAASSANVYAFGCLVYVKPTQGTTLGLNAAIHVAYTFDDTTWKEIDVYGANTSSTTRASMTAPTAPYLTYETTNYPFKVACATTGSTNFDGAVAGDAYVYIPLYAGASRTSYATQNEIKQVRVVIYICGPDSDCVTSGTGVGATINLEFVALTNTDA